MGASQICCAGSGGYKGGEVTRQIGGGIYDEDVAIGHELGVEIRLCAGQKKGGNPRQ